MKALTLWTLRNAFTFEKVRSESAYRQRAQSEIIIISASDAARTKSHRIIGSRTERLHAGKTEFTEFGLLELTYL